MESNLVRPPVVVTVKDLSLTSSLNELEWAGAEWVTLIKVEVVPKRVAQG